MLYSRSVREWPEDGGGSLRIETPQTTVERED
jgi:hypothetical protein